jgi:hypothetical protein
MMTNIGDRTMKISPCLSMLVGRDSDAQEASLVGSDFPSSCPVEVVVQVGSVVRNWTQSPRGRKLCSLPVRVIDLLDKHLYFAFLQDRAMPTQYTAVAAIDKGVSKQDPSITNIGCVQLGAKLAKLIIRGAFTAKNVSHYLDILVTQ